MTLALARALTASEARFSSAMRIVLDACVEYPPVSPGNGLEKVRYPYIGMIASFRQLLETAEFILRYGGTRSETAEDEALAALLHDLVRRMNGGEALERIRAELGDHVAELTLQCAALTEREEGGTWQTRKERLLERLQSAPESVRFIEAASRLQFILWTMHEYRGVAEKLWERRRGGRDGTLWFNRALLATLRSTAPHGTHWDQLLDGLDEAIRDLEMVVATKECRIVP